MEDKQGLTLEEVVKVINDMDEIAVSDPIIHDLIVSSDYKARFVGEYAELKIRYNKLHKMLIKHEAGTLGFEPTCDISTIEDKAYHIDNYLKQLKIRDQIEKKT